MKNIIIIILLMLCASTHQLAAQTINTGQPNMNQIPKTMQTQNYTTTLLLSQTPAQVFDAINNVRGWWSEQIEGRTDVLHATFNYHYQDVHRCQMEIIELIPNQKVVWLVKDNYFNFIKDQTEWKGTKISFEISKHGPQTRLIFTHIGLTPTYECYNICADAWSNYIGTSLKNLIEIGKGNPNPYQAAINSAAEKKSTNQNYTISFLLDKAPSTVFDAIGDVQKWWSNDFIGNSKSTGDEFSVTFGNVHYSKHKVLESIPFKKIVWLVTDSRLSFLKNQSEWNGTENIFEISTEKGKTKLTFTHVGLIPSIECFGDCSKGWNHYLKESLIPYIQSGKGNPNKIN